MSDLNITELQYLIDLKESEARHLEAELDELYYMLEELEGGYEHE